MAMAVAGDFKAFKRGGDLIGAETVGIDDRGVKLVLQCALMEA
jgi:hypothetical protein